MSELTKVPDNVWTFLGRASADIGRFEEERFSQEAYTQIVEDKISSPIEQLFLVALQALARASYIDLDPYPYELHGEMVAGSGVHQTSQHKIGKYRVDFFITRTWRDCGDFGQRGTDRSESVIVELDGHDFHDRDKHQRSYEKARNRYLQREGYRVLHYTGSDVVADPYRIAHEVLEMVGSLAVAYDATNPLGLD